MKRFIQYIVVSLMALAATGCQDDFMKQEIIGEGKAKVSATVDFKPMSSTLTRAAGDALKDINSLHVLLYDEKKTLIKGWKLEETDYKVTTVNRDDEDAENKQTAETSTQRATFKLSEGIDFGRYYMYAVANIPDLLDKKDDIQTVDGLKSLPLTWNPDNMTANGQMIGYFTKTSAIQPENQPIVLNQHSMSLHAWLRRAASKVTIAYDGSALKEGVFIYLQLVQIKDIPVQCYLGKDNNVGLDGYTLNVTQDGKFPETDETGTGTSMLDGEIIKYHEGDIPENFEYGEDCADHRITVGNPHIGSHNETDPALYFYENMQGAGDDKPDKRQDSDGKDGLDHPGLPGDNTYRLKDDVPYGTYIEVQAHYISNNTERLGNGHIVYRFMLGQDVIKDYNAKRNCHYKLTLKFKNFANEADWHIEYEEPEPGVMTPPYYISYLYNRSMMYPIKVNTGGHPIEYIKAEIIDNRWAPHNADPSADPPIYYAAMDKPGENPWNGFLSLHKTTETAIRGSGEASELLNKTYYETAPKRGERMYTNFEEGEHITDGLDIYENYHDDKYRVEKHPTEANTYNIFIPMYTRAKQLYPQTGYTGNNPYVAYQRKAVVRIITKLQGVDKEFTNDVPIYQVRRVVNPKGIYRSSGNNKSFHVVLKRLPEEDAVSFEPFQSEGPWKAYIAAETNGEGIVLSASGGSEARKDTICGKTGSLIDFRVNFNGSSAGNRYAIIRVEYHNYTCHHLIFVRQGNEPDYLIDGEALWYAENMKTKTERTASPLEEGSLFRFGNWNDPIDASSNKYQKNPWINVIPGDFKVEPEDGFLIAGTSNTRKTWTGITNQPATGTFANPSTGMRVARLQDYLALQKDDLEQGYGILYGDDAVETADHINDAYGYDYENTTEGRGMRGCFAYNKTTGKSLFFPIGASGYGKRKTKENGILRYSAGQTNYHASPTKAPLFYDLFRRPGAVYWSENKGENDQIGWDINYFTLDFNPIFTNNVFDGTSSDACFVRCVKD